MNEREFYKIIDSIHHSIGELNRFEQDLWDEKEK